MYSNEFQKPWLQISIRDIYIYQYISEYSKFDILEQAH